MVIQLAGTRAALDIEALSDEVCVTADAHAQRLQT